jgi:hypothetical protein
MLNPDCVFAIKITPEVKFVQVDTTSNCSGQTQLREEQESQPKMTELAYLSAWHLS